MRTSSSNFNLHTYIHNITDDYNPSVSIINLCSHTTYVVCVISYISGGTYRLKSTPNDRSFEKLFMAILFIFKVFARYLLRGNCRRYIYFCTLFWCVAWSSNPGFMSNKPTHYLLDHGDFISLINSHLI